MKPHHQAGDWVSSLCSDIAQAGEALATHFPHAGDADVNELSDEISTSA